MDEPVELTRRELHRWFTEACHDRGGTDGSGSHGTPQQLRERLGATAGATHLLLNPVTEFAEQVAAVAKGFHKPMAL